MWQFDFQARRFDFWQTAKLKELVESKTDTQSQNFKNSKNIQENNRKSISHC